MEAVQSEIRFKYNSVRVKISPSGCHHIQQRQTAAVQHQHQHRRCFEGIVSEIYCFANSTQYASLGIAVVGVNAASIVSANKSPHEYSRSKTVCTCFHFTLPLFHTNLSYAESISQNKDRQRES
jgi:hypothetical protein